jgi:mannan polymerase II complex MNN11 subunit
MTLFPQASFYFYLDPHTLIMNPKLSLDAHVTQKDRLESLMITDIPVVPPDSVIKTFSGLKGDRVDLILTQDKDGLSEKSFIVRKGEWAKYLLDAWFDPLYRTYNFQKAERHALEHIVQ